LIVDDLSMTAVVLLALRQSSIIHRQSAMGLPGGVIGNTGGFGPPIPGSSPGRVAWDLRLLIYDGRFMLDDLKETDRAGRFVTRNGKSSIKNHTSCIRVPYV
jgi:hypothetical protein